MYVAMPFSITAIATAKISVLCLYRRIFTTQSFRQSSLMVGVGVVAYWVASVVCVLLQCVPIRKNWQPELQARCINTAALFLGLELFIMLFLPLRVIRDLHMPLKQRLQLGVIFLLGGL